MLKRSVRMMSCAHAALLCAAACGDNTDTVVISGLDQRVPVVIVAVDDNVVNDGSVNEAEQPAPSDAVDSESLPSARTPPETDNLGDSPERGAPVVPEPLEFSAAPALIQNPNPSVPMAAILDFETSVPASVEVIVVGGGERWTITRPESKTLHHYPLYGFKPATNYALQIVARSADTEAFSDPLPFGSPPLPDEFPPLQVGISEPDSMEPGLTLFNARIPGWTFLVMLDGEGTVRWYYRNNDAPLTTAHALLRNGNIAGPLGSRDRIVESDLLGNEVRRWHAAGFPGDLTPREGSVPVDAETFHHELFEMPSGNLLTLATTLRTVEGYPVFPVDSSGTTETATVASDVILEFDRAGNIVKRYPLLDLLDPTRVTYDSGSGFWNQVYGRTDTKDWSHANAVSYDAGSDAYLVSVRHQDAVIKVSREDGALKWILGPHDNWRAPWSEKLLAPSGGINWQYHQHAVKLTPGGGIGMFDNGNNRTSPPAPQPDIGEMYSRAVEYDVNEENMTVSERSSFGPPATASGSFYARFISDADWMSATGNILVTPGGQRTTAEPQYDFAQIIEVTPAGQKVFELTMKDAPETARSMTIYRAERVPDIRR